MSVRVLDASSPTLVVVPVPGMPERPRFDLLNAGRQIARFASPDAAQRFARRFYDEDAPAREGK